MAPASSITVNTIATTASITTTSLSSRCPGSQFGGTVPRSAGSQFGGIVNCPSDPDPPFEPADIQTSYAQAETRPAGTCSVVSLDSKYTAYYKVLATNWCSAIRVYKATSGSVHRRLDFLIMGKNRPSALTRAQLINTVATGALTLRVQSGASTVTCTASGEGWATFYYSSIRQIEVSRVFGCESRMAPTSSITVNTICQAGNYHRLISGNTYECTPCPTISASQTIPTGCNNFTCRAGTYVFNVHPSGGISCAPCPTTAKVAPTGCERHTTLITTPPTTTPAAPATPAAPKTAAPSSTPSPAPAPSAPAAPASPEIPSHSISTQHVLCQATPNVGTSLTIEMGGILLSNFWSRFTNKLMNFSDDEDDSYFVKKLEGFAEYNSLSTNKPKDFFQNVQKDINNEIDCYICFNGHFYGSLGSGYGCHDCSLLSSVQGIALTHYENCGNPCAGSGLADLSICVAGGVNSENIVEICESASLKQLEYLFNQIKFTENRDLKNAIQNAADAKAHSEKLEREGASNREIAAVETELTARCRILDGLIRLVE